MDNQFDLLKKVLKSKYTGYKRLHARNEALMGAGLGGTIGTGVAMINHNKTDEKDRPKSYLKNILLGTGAGALGGAGFGALKGMNHKRKDIDKIIKTITNTMDQIGAEPSDYDDLLKDVFIPHMQKQPSVNVFKQGSEDDNFGAAKMIGGGALGAAGLYAMIRGGKMGRRLADTATGYKSNLPIDDLISRFKSYGAAAQDGLNQRAFLVGPKYKNIMSKVPPSAAVYEYDKVLPAVRDPKIRETLMQRLKNHGGHYKEFGDNPDWATAKELYTGNPSSAPESFKPLAHISNEISEADLTSLLGDKTKDLDYYLSHIKGSPENSALRKHLNDRGDIFFKQAPKHDAAAKAYGRLSSGLGLAEGGLLAGGGLALASSGMKDKKAAEEKPTKEVPYDKILDGIGTAGALGTGAAFHQFGGTRMFDTAAAPKIQVIGGPKPFATDPRVPMDSFSAQTHSLTRGLRDTGLDVDHATWPTAKQSLFDAIKKIYRAKDYDAVVRVGHAFAHPGVLADRGKVKYRLNSDFTDGNFVNNKNIYYPVMGQDAMAVRENAKYYDRFFTPGPQTHQMPDEFSGKNPSVMIGNIPVSPVFRETPFVEKDWSPTAKRKAFLTMGGGNAAPMMFDELGEHFDKLAPDAYRPVSSQSYNINKRFFLDDIMDSMRQLHGDNFELNFLLGQKVDPATGKFSTHGLHGSTNDLYDQLAQYVKTPEGQQRFKGMNLLSSLPQQDMAKHFAESHYVFATPGSTSAEILAMGGENPGKVVSLLPNDKPETFMKHFPSNAKMVHELIPSAHSFDITDPQRKEKLVQALQEQPQRMVGRQGFKTDFTQLRPVIEQDVRAKKIRNLKMLAATGGLSIAALLASKAYQMIKGRSNEKTAFIDDRSLAGVAGIDYPAGPRPMPGTALPTTPAAPSIAPTATLSPWANMWSKAKPWVGGAGKTLLGASALNSAVEAREQFGKGDVFGGTANSADALSMGMGAAGKYSGGLGSTIGRRAGGAAVAFYLAQHAKDLIQGGGYEATGNKLYDNYLNSGSWMGTEKNPFNMTLALGGGINRLLEQQQETGYSAAEAQQKADLAQKHVGKAYEAGLKQLSPDELQKYMAWNQQNKPSLDVDLLKKVQSFKQPTPAVVRQTADPVNPQPTKADGSPAPVDQQVLPEQTAASPLEEKLNANFGKAPGQRRSTGIKNEDGSDWANPADLTTNPELKGMSYDQYSKMPAEKPVAPPKTKGTINGLTSEERAKATPEILAGADNPMGVPNEPNKSTLVNSGQSDANGNPLYNETAKQKVIPVAPKDPYKANAFIGKPLPKKVIKIGNYEFDVSNSGSLGYPQVNLSRLQQQPKFETQTAQVVGDLNIPLMTAATRPVTPAFDTYSEQTVGNKPMPLTTQPSLSSAVNPAKFDTQTTQVVGNPEMTPLPKENKATAPVGVDMPKPAAPVSTTTPATAPVAPNVKISSLAPTINPMKQPGMVFAHEPTKRKLKLKLKPPVNKLKL